MKNTHVNFSTISANDEVADSAACRRSESGCITSFVAQSNELHMRDPGEGLQIIFSHLVFCDMRAHTLLHTASIRMRPPQLGIKPMTLCCLC